MGFESLSPQRLAERERWGDRLPPGQRPTAKWPVLHYGAVPAIDLAAWRLRVSGLVANPLELTWDELLALPQTASVSDVHCVTRWSRFDNGWAGVLVRDLLTRAEPLPVAAFALAHAYGGYSANLPLDALLADDAILAHTHEGEPLAPEHGGPLRLVVPSRYFWKSVKWLSEIELGAEGRPGFWERHGYHNDADPWAEERFAKGRSRTGAY